MPFHCFIIEGQKLGTLGKSKFIKHANNGGFHLVGKIMRELKSHMIPYKFQCSHWLKLHHSDWRANFVKNFFFK